MTLPQPQIVAAALAVSFSFGCVSTNFSSITDPAYRGKTLERILVVGDDPQIDNIVKIEEAVAEVLKKTTNTYPYLATLIMPPTRTYSDEEFFAILDARHIDAYLVVSVVGSGYGVSSTTIRTRPGKSVTRGQFSQSGDRINYSGTTEYTPPSEERIDIRKPNASFASRLYSAVDGGTIWMATSQSGGSAFVSISNLITHHAKEIRDKLVEEKFLHSTAKSNLDR